MKHRPSDKKWTRKPYFVLPIDKQRVQRNQPFISVPLYLSILQMCTHQDVTTVSFCREVKKIKSRVVLLALTISKKYVTTMELLVGGEGGKGI